jgi:type II secretory pathway component PulL|tara:strand:- start:2 stop:469 length:468 start_codon:yes stop_codon:yes gene_type:complete
MIDPISAVAMATSAFKMVQKMVSAGREIEDTLGQVGKWYGAASDFNEAKRQAENPPLFKRLIASKSIEQEAMEMFANNKRIQQQEKELRELLMYTYGANAYQELQGMRRSIKEQREKTVYAQARRRKAFIWNSIALSVIGAMGYVLYLMIKAVTM